MRAMVREDDECSRHVRQQGAQHAREEVPERRREVRARPKREVILHLAICPAARGVQGVLEVDVLVNVQEQKLQRRRRRFPWHRGRGQKGSECLSRGHVDKLTVRLPIIPLPIGHRPPAHTLHLAVSIPRDDDGKARNRALIHLAVSQRLLPLAFGILWQRARHIEALQERDERMLLEKQFALVRHEKHHVSIAHDIDAQLEVRVT
mmetsp:Transcript_13278/g.28694  ORF Transcript_13278/g.28694 Transcript_13278/m.28694 type:complete len:206 (-) Transcript_13278:181-798(-)